MDSSSEPGFPDSQCTHQPGPAGPPPRKPSVWSSPCLRWKAVGGSSRGGRTAEQLLHFLLDASPPHPRPSRPYPAGLPPTLGWPACPAPLPGPGWALVHLSSTRCLIKPPRKQGQPVGAEEGAALGHVWPQGFFGPCSNLTPPENGSGLPDLTGCEYMHARVCVFVCVQLGPSGVGSPSNSPSLWP